MVKATARPDVLTRARELRAKRYTLAAIAEILEDEEYPTARGARWSSTVVLGLLNRAHPFTASLAPCSVCGDLTASKYGICPRRPGCRPAYIQANNRAAAERLRELRGPAEPGKPCAACGRLTYSALDVCARPSCINEYARAVRAASGGGSSVYAVWFPVPSILKVGFSTHTVASMIAGITRGRAKERGWETSGSSCIWQKPGDNRTEAWIQATLSFRWRSPFEARDGRMCEWFTVHHLTVEEVTGVLDSTYRIVPPDLTGRALS